MKNASAGFLLSMQFLTRIPVPVEVPWNAQTSRWALRAYPLIGLLIGLIPVLFVWMEVSFSPLVQAMMIVTFFVWISGGLHLDGWMDVFDAAGSNAPLDKKWEIMKDPHVGSFGIAALLFLLGWKVVLVHELLVQEASPLIFMIYPALARWKAAVLLTVVPAAKPSGLAHTWQKHITGKDAFLAGVPFAAAFIFSGSFLFIWAAFGAGIFLVLYRLWILKHFKGINGDLAGASIEGGELWTLFILWIFISSGMV
ncbi:adenosylcobinamide-GDP ribazoletransferase [Alkalicoccus halolimnae]|uniref:Adenosylcobinamide-GDP ribazoletransferase n=1 Tax=Alkalicoccus halolimnae TaxID=1667239 RepID=A0A5C7FF30_9BACI|nr:adenosylcobinamide-GDP ribazoletransferase [Alkalicoccus halolimnae]TXF82783.1 adenosylcobinamide-GDP ribazoletransferase [Alkalicoccus halolimnae]